MNLTATNSPNKYSSDYDGNSKLATVSDALGHASRHDYETQD
ncbi:hypothetical protein [Roseateles sp.]|nr:hypothetical protein [Roseateles sp.]